jgi:hypothetical protein
MLSFFLGQIQLLNVLAAPIWLSGLYFLVFSRRGQSFRFFGLTYIFLWIAFVALRGKVYYIGPMYPLLIGAGAVFLEGVSRSGNWRPLIRYALPAVVLLSGILLAPFAIPVLPVETFIRYQHALGLNPPKTETIAVAILPQNFSDMFGWEEMTATVAKVYQGLTPEQQHDAVIFANNYGEAAAIDFFGPRYGLPKAVSGHMAYYVWGPPKQPFNILIAIEGDEAAYRRAFGSVQRAATVGTEYSMPNEHGPIYLCRDPKVSMSGLWPRTKVYR